MKTAVSIPNNVFDSAEKLASQLGRTRSQLYAQALNSYVAKHKAAGVVKKLNDVYASEDATLDSALGTMQSLTILKEKW